jgi:DNA-directed RNA polymerase I and III subunit RPAC1
VHDDILLAKLRPGQSISIEMRCVKGIGKEHAKWSPVGTASYRLLPEVVLTEPVKGELAHKLKACFASGVIEVERGPDGVEFAVVANSRASTSSREVHRHPELADSVVLRKKRDHFIFSVESTGALPAAQLVRLAITIFGEKVINVKRHLEIFEGTEAMEDDDSVADEEEEAE